MIRILILLSSYPTILFDGLYLLERSAFIGIMMSVALQFFTQRLQLSIPLRL